MKNLSNFFQLNINKISWQKIMSRSFMVKMSTALVITGIGLINNISLPHLILLVYGSIFILFKIHYRSAIILVTLFIFLAVVMLILKNTELAKTFLLYTFYVTLAIAVIERKIYMPLAIFLLALSPIMLSLGFVETSEIMAIYAFFLLALTILIQFYNLITAEKNTSQ